jgi:Fur family peroxide stress response transcriptional regulator
MTEAKSTRKQSKKRNAILELIQSVESHPGARWVYERLKPQIPGLSLGTVYRNLNIFREQGDVLSVGVVNGEERFDGRTEPHPHFICETCGAVIDLGGKNQPEINAIISAKIPGCVIDKRKTVFYGLCKACNAFRRAETQGGTQSRNVRRNAGTQTVNVRP